MPQTATLLETETPAILAHNQTSARVWGAGGRAYDRISRQIADAIEHAVDRLDPQPGERILDVATGTGWTARRVAARAAVVTGVDIGEEVIAAAHELSPDESIDFQVGDAEALPFPDGHFDAVISTFGVMFSTRPERAARELARRYAGLGESGSTHVNRVREYQARQREPRVVGCRVIRRIAIALARSPRQGRRAAA